MALTGKHRVVGGEIIRGRWWRTARLMVSPQHIWKPFLSVITLRHHHHLSSGLVWVDLVTFFYPYLPTIHFPQSCQSDILKCNSDHVTPLLQPFCFTINIEEKSHLVHRIWLLLTALISCHAFLFLIGVLCPTDLSVPIPGKTLTGLVLFNRSPSLCPRFSHVCSLSFMPQLKGHLFSEGFWLHASIQCSYLFVINFNLI